jgi:Ser-tRNA(Ala) deacylase AlaX
MSKIWNDLKSNMKDWSNAAVEKAEEVSKVAVAKTEELTRISKVKLSIHQLYRDKNKELSSLGKLVYNHSKEANMSNFTGNSEFFSYVEKIDSINAQIIEKENEIDEIKTENINDDEITIENEAIKSVPASKSSVSEDLEPLASDEKEYKSPE